MTIFICHLVPDDGVEFFLDVESRLKLLVHTSPPSVEVIDVEEAGVSPRLFVKLKRKRRVCLKSRFRCRLLLMSFNLTTKLHIKR